MDKGIHELQEMIQNFSQILIKPESSNSSPISDHKILQSYIREIYHSLMTPLAQIDVSWSTVNGSISSNEEIVKKQLEYIKDGVELIKSILYAYRQVAFYSFHESTDDIFLIENGIKSAISIYKREYNKMDVEITYDNLPDRIKGYSNNYILAMFLPLLENAIYASKTNQKVEIRYSSDNDYHYLKIINPLNSQLDIKDLEKKGFSTKEENGKKHDGVGLSVVRNLINNIPDSKLIFEALSDNTLLTILKIHNNG